MSASKPLNFESVTIGGTTHELMDTESAEISNEAEKLTVDASQEVISSVLSGLQFMLYDLSVMENASVLTDSVVDPDTDKTTVSLNGAQGSSTITITDVYVTGVLDFSNPSPAAAISLQRRGSGSTLTIS